MSILDKREPGSDGSILRLTTGGSCVSIAPEHLMEVMQWLGSHAAGYRRVAADIRERLAHGNLVRDVVAARRADEAAITVDEIIQCVPYPTSYSSYRVARDAALIAMDRYMARK